MSRPHVRALLAGLALSLAPLAAQAAWARLVGEEIIPGAYGQPDQRVCYYRDHQNRTYTQVISVYARCLYGIEV